MIDGYRFESNVVFIYFFKILLFSDMIEKFQCYSKSKIMHHLSIFSLKGLIKFFNMFSERVRVVFEIVL